MNLSENIFGVKSRSHALRELAIDFEKALSRPPGVGLTDIEALKGRTLTKDFNINNKHINRELDRRESLRRCFSEN
jgi:hypothetical protein